MVKTRKDSCLCAYSSLLFAELVLSLCEHIGFIVSFSSTSVLSFHVDCAITAMMHI
jgi:inner membrane protein involved in colicin E2 resistance